MATAIFKRLNIPHVKYSLTWDNGVPYSVCENFITTKTELVSAFYIHNTNRISQNLYEHYLTCCFELGIPSSRQYLDQMLVADFLIANSDRHLNNFGAIRNAETLEWITAAPLYDNGSSLWYNYANIKDRIHDRSQPFAETHDEQIKLVRDFSWANLGNLSDADEEFYELLKFCTQVSADRRDELCLALKKQVKKLRQIRSKS